MTPADYASAARCCTCHKWVHPWMPAERLIASLFNAVANGLARVTGGRRAPEAHRN